MRMERSMGVGILDEERLVLVSTHTLSSAPAVTPVVISLNCLGTAVANLSFVNRRRQCSCGANPYSQGLADSYSL